MNIEEQLKQMLKIPVIEERYLELIKLLNEDRDRLMKQNKRYKQALEMYADIDSYVGDIQWIVVDQGSYAREALKVDK